VIDKNATVPAMTFGVINTQGNTPGRCSLSSGGRVLQSRECAPGFFLRNDRRHYAERSLKHIASLETH
jgi:hypothetical protein